LWLIFQLRLVFGFSLDVSPKSLSFDVNSLLTVIWTRDPTDTLAFIIQLTDETASIDGIVHNQDVSVNLTGVTVSTATGMVQFVLEDPG
jgi:hypothetical protein